MHKFKMKFIEYFKKTKGAPAVMTTAPPAPPQPPGPPPPVATTTTTMSNQQLGQLPQKQGAELAPTTPSLLRKILPLGAFSVAFAIVMTILILYMNNTAMRHYQFRVNMSQDYEFLNVSQDDPQLITYIRQFHLKLANDPQHKPLPPEDIGAPDDTIYVLKLLNNKRDGVFIESGAYNDGKSSKTDWLEKKYNWHGLLIQAESRHFFGLKRRNRIRSQAIHACLSSMPYPKEVVLHQENEVKINSIYTNSIVDDSDVRTRIKCFPLYSLLLAMNNTNIDYFSLESAGNELQVLETIPFELVNIKIIAVHLLTSTLERNLIKAFLNEKDYTFIKSFNKTDIYLLHRIKI